LPDWSATTYTLETYGRELYRLAFPGEIGKELEECRQKYATGRDVLRIVIQMEVIRGKPNELGNLPWELLHDGKG
jgi:hypothetical protein